MITFNKATSNPLLAEKMEVDNEVPLRGLLQRNRHTCADYWGRAILVCLCQS